MCKHSTLEETEESEPELEEWAVMILKLTEGLGLTEAGTGCLMKLTGMSSNSWTQINDKMKSLSCQISVLDFFQVVIGDSCITTSAAGHWS